MEMEKFLLQQDQFIRSVEISQDETFAIFLGAGASITSGISSAGDCIWEWKKSIYTSKTGRTQGPLNIKAEPVKQLIQRWLDSEGTYPAAYDETEYSYYIEQCYPIEDDRRKFFQKICARKTPSIGYKLVSLLHEAGMVHSIWTTNFDDCPRDAGITTGNVVIDISLETVDRVLRPQNQKELLLIKLHGDYKYGPLKNTAVELQHQDATFRARLIEYLADKHLIVSGYSGRDQSVMDALAEAYAKPGGGRLYWCGYGTTIPPNVMRLLEIANKNGRTAYYIPTNGFDDLFTSLGAACTKANTGLHNKFQEYLKAAGTGKTRSEFTMDIPRYNSIVKSNFFEITFPQEVYQFDITYQEGEKAWQTLRSITEGTQVVAVPHSRTVWALGTLTDINNLFSSRMKGKISRISIGDLQLAKDSSLHHLLLSSITKLFGDIHQLPHDGRGLIWNPRTETNKRVNNVIYFTHQAIRLSICSDGGRYFLSLLPDFHATAELDGIKPSKEVYQEIGRSYFDKIWNEPFNNYVDEWRKRFLHSPDTKIELEFPHQSGTGLFFTIRKSPGFAGIYSESQNGKELSRSFPNNLLLHSGIKYPEPQLVFSPRYNDMAQIPKDFHPMRGVSANRPYDYKIDGAGLDDSIKLGVICPQPDAAKFSQFLQRHLSKITYNGKNKAYIISYPGFSEAFSTPLNIPQPGDPYWSYYTEPTKADSIKNNATELRSQLIKSIDQISADAVKKVIVIYIPSRLLEFTSYDLDNEQYDLHDFIKAYCAARNIATQFIQEKTISDPLTCQINWWLALSYYVKSMRTPWVLDSLDQQTAFAGIGYSVINQRGNTDIVIGCSHIYNSQGQGLKYRLSKMNDDLIWDRQKRPHLSYNDAYRLGLSTIDLFYNTMNELPKRVVIHKRTHFMEDEMNGLKDSLLSHGVTELDLIEINFEDDMRFVASKLDDSGMPKIDNYAVPRGTCILLNHYEALLWTHGVVPSVENQYYKFYLGGRYIPGPLRVIKHYGNGNIGQIAQEILGLTKMNWNSFDLYSQLPATVNSSNEIARIGRHLPRKEGVTYDYRYFI